jgi:RNA-directed DNA polymerase
VINTIKHLCYELRSSTEELERIVKNIDKYYYEKVEVKLNKDGTPKFDGNGKPKTRILHPSIDRLKKIQDRVLHHVLDKLEIPEYIFGAVKGHDNVMNAKKHQGKKFIFTTDLKDFFPSINHRMVFEMFRSRNFSPTVSRILTQLTTYKGKLPQGTPTSPMIANLVFTKTGDKLQDLAKRYNITFTSFIDDLTFSSPTDFKDLAQSFLKIISTEGFKVSHKKTNYKTKDPIVTGILVKNNNLALTKFFKNKMSNTGHLRINQINGLKQYAQKISSSN